MKAIFIVLICALAAPLLMGGEADCPAKVSPGFSLAPAQEPTPKAEWYLRDLAESSRHARTGGTISLGIGAALTAAGVIMIAGVKDSEDFGDFFTALGGVLCLGMGGTFMIGGAGTLIVASGPVRRYKAVMAIADPIERERAGRLALSSLARSGKTKRYAVSGILSALAIVTVTTSANPEVALVPAGLAVYQFFRKSREERAYAAFLAGGDVIPESIDIGFGPGPRGGFRVALTASF